MENPWHLLSMGKGTLAQLCVLSTYPEFLPKCVKEGYYLCLQVLQSTGNLLAWILSQNQ